MPVTRVPEEELQTHFETWLRRVEEGEQLVITREGREIAQVRAMDESLEGASLPTLKEWRASIEVRGEGLSTAVLQQREEERF